MDNVSGHGNAENYWNQGAENPSLTMPLLEQVNMMQNEGAPEYFMDQGLYYPIATDYGYYCTGFESPSEWEDHHGIFGADGPQVQYAGAQSESLPYVYYTPSYGYAQSPYNPYNPYLPGALVGVDGLYVGAQQYYAISPNQDPISSPAYVSVAQPDFVSNNTTDPLLANGNRSNGRSAKYGRASSSVAFNRNHTKTSSNLTNSFSKESDGLRTNTRPSKQSFTNGSVSSGSFLSPASSRMIQGRDASGSMKPADNISSGKQLTYSNKLKVAIPSNNGFSGLGSSVAGRTTMDNGNLNSIGEQNHGSRTNNPKDQLTMKAYATKMGGSAQGQIIIHTDQYNKGDFAVDYVDAKFFVIKSYSEDDVHKSIKYNVWSSTSHGNKKLQTAYEDAQRVSSGRPRGCPIFLFFSVNASGQFCGVAEMIGPVDFQKDMDFWQHDKWSGSFPVKWHMIKDVANSCFRNIILENNEKKPVTNSRDTQEIMCKKGVEMLKIFKNYKWKTSILDDFVYYEDRQRIMQEEKAELAYKTLEAPIFVPAFVLDEKLHHLADVPAEKDTKITKLNGISTLQETESSDSKQFTSTSDLADVNNEITYTDQTLSSEAAIAPLLKFGSLSINPEQDNHISSCDIASGTGTDGINVVTVGLMPVKADVVTEPPASLIVGSIELDTRALLLNIGEKGGVSAESRSLN